MLIEFTVGNFRSFKDPVTLSMVAADLGADNLENVTDNAFDAGGDLKLLKTAALYGANASGKSNFIMAMDFMRATVIKLDMFESKIKNKSSEVFRLHEDSVKEPHHFEMVFILGEARYRYGFEFDTRQVVAEWLYVEESEDELELFIREQGELNVTDTDKFDRQSEGLFDKTREDRLFLSVVSEFNGKISRKIVDWFKDIKLFYGVHNPILEYEAETRFENDNYREIMLDIVKSADTGIDDIRVENVPISEDKLRSYLNTDAVHVSPGFKGAFHKKIRTYHRRYGAGATKGDLEEFDFKTQESDGTQRIFWLAGLWAGLFVHGGIAFIDELDARLHPLMTAEIIRLFNSKDTNPKNAQLIFTTHDTNLLDQDLFRPDQIWFLEKDGTGVSNLFSLVEYKLDEKELYEREYLRGKYGAIPYIIKRNFQGIEEDA